MNKRDKISNAKIIKAINDAYGIVTTAAVNLRPKVDRHTLQGWINEDDELKKALEAAREGELKDLIESELVKNIKAGREASIIFAAKTQLRSRGYVEKLEITDKSKITDQIKEATEEELLDIISKSQKRIADAKG